MPHYSRSSRSRGFTLVELMLVIIILGILAAICLPMIGAVRGDVCRTATDTASQEAQKAIHLYWLQLGRLPDLSSGWTPLTTITTTDGKSYGPYLIAPPLNQLVTSAAGQSTVADSPTELVLSQAAFAYDYQGGNGSGRLIASTRTTP